MENNFEENYRKIYDDYIGNREDIEDEIEEVSAYIAEKLICKDNNVWCEFQDDIYKFKMSKGIKDWKNVAVIAALRYFDPDKKDNGRTYKIEIELDKKLTELENIKYGVKTLFQHIVGIIQPEELED